MDRNNIVHLLIVPPDKLEVSLIRATALILNIDAYETRLLLSGEIPKIIAHYRNEEEAKFVANKIEALGIGAVLVDEFQLRKSTFPIFLSYTMKIDSEGVTFWDKRGQLKRMATKDIFLILKGRIDTNPVKEVEKISMKFNLPATILTGGLPVWRKVKEKTKETTSEASFFLRLYDRISSEPQVEIMEDHFDFAFLGSEITASSFTNLNIAISRLRKAFTQAIYDDRLAKPSLTPEEEIELNCKLIYLSYLSESTATL